LHWDAELRAASASGQIR